MTLNDDRLHELAERAEAAARAAGAVIAGHFGERLAVHHKARGTSAASRVVTAVDHNAQAAILALLQPTCATHGLALLSEESNDDGERLKRPAFWSIDPLDGTLAFIEGTPGFSVSIALVARDGTPLIGVVHDPLEGTLYRALCGHGADRNGAPIQSPSADPDRPLVLATDRSFHDHPWREATHAGLRRIAGELGLAGAEIHFRVGAVMNACGVLESPNHCYFKYPREGESGGSVWDYAATACLLREAGAVAGDIHGAPMELNRMGSTFMNHRGILYAGNRLLAERISRLYRELAV